MKRDARSATPIPDSPPPSSHRRSWSRLGLKVWAVPAILALSFGLVSLHVKAYRTFSPFDERQHVDYLYRISRGELLRMGQQVGQETLRDEACRGLDWNQFTPPPCHPNRPYDPGVYPDLGYNSAHVHPPTYYFLTNLIMKANEATGIARNFVSSGRISGGLWLGLALVLFWYAAGELRIPARSRVVAMALLATTPTIVHASSIVNPDSTSLMAGSGMLLGTLVWERRRRRTIFLLLLTAVLVVALKFTNILVVVAAVLYLMLRWRFAKQQTDRDPRAIRGYLVAAAALLVVALGTAALWIVAHNQLIQSPVNPQLEQFQVDSLSADAIVGQMMALVTPVRDPWLSPSLNKAAIKGILQLLNLALLAAVFGAPFFQRSWRPATLVAISGGLVILVSGMALTIANFYLNSRAYVAIPPRYGISVLPFLFIALASALRRTAVFWAVALLAVLSVLSVLSGLLAAI